MVYATAPLSSEVMQYKKVVIDTTEKGEVYALIDGTLATGSNVTEIIKIAGGSIENFLITDERDFTVRTLRTLDVVSRDIDGDGHYEIPCSKAIPGAPIVGEESSASLVQWHSFTGDDLEGRGYSLVSAEFGYIFNYPVEWGNDVTVIQQRDGNEWRFYYFDRSQGESGESTDIEILRLRVYENNDYVDEEITEGYTVVGKNDRFTYYLYLPQQTPDNSAPLSITEESFAEHFEF